MSAPAHRTGTSPRAAQGAGHYRHGATLTAGRNDESEDGDLTLPAEEPAKAHRGVPAGSSI